MINETKDELKPEQELHDSKFVEDQETTHEFIDIIESYQPQEFKDQMDSCEKCKRYHFSDQWDEKKRKLAKERKQYIVTIPKTKDIVNHVTGMMTANNPAFSMKNFGEEDFHLTRYAQKLVNFVWDEERGNHKLRKMVKTGNRDNVGYLFSYWDTEQKMVKLKPLSYDEVIIDPASKDSLYEDAEYIWIRREVSKKTLKDVYGITDPMMERPQTWGNSLVDSKGKQTAIQRLYANNKQPGMLYEGYTYTYKGGKKRVERVVVAGYSHYYKELLPEGITMRGLVSHYAESNDKNPYHKGVGHFLLDIQDALNTAYATMLYNAQVGSNNQTFMPKELIPMGDVAKLEKEMSIPGKIIPLEGDMERMVMPVQKMAQPIASAWYTIVGDMFSIFENHIKANPEDWSTKDVTRLMEQKKQVMTAFIEMEGILEENIERLGKIVFQLGRVNFTDKQLEKILNVSEVKDRMEVNLKNGLDMKDPEIVKQFTESLRQRGANEKQINIALEKAQEDFDQWDILNKVLTGKELLGYDLKVVKGSYSKNYEDEMFIIATDLVQKGQIPSKWAVKYAPLTDREQIMEEIDELAIMKRQAEELTQSALDKDKTIEQLNNALNQTKVKMFDGDLKRRNDKVVTENRYKSMNSRKQETSRVNKVVSDKSHQADKMINDALLDLKKKMLDYDVAKKKVKAGVEGNNSETVKEATQ